VRVHVVCFGNLLGGDDGFGIHVCQRLRGRALATTGADAHVFDAGLSGLAALTHFEGCDVVLVVDALAYAGEEGRVERLQLADLSLPREAFSAHALDLNHLLHVLPIVFEGRAQPEVIVVGAQIRPPACGFSMELSPAIARAADEAVKRVEAELTALALRGRV
jgi:hydrogenase maturation protease